MQMTHHIRKRILIPLIVLAVLGAAAGLLFLFFPQIPAYFRIRNENPVRMQDYPLTHVTVPADFAERSAHGITVKAPADCLNPRESGLVLFKNDRLTVAVMSSEDSPQEFESPDVPFTEAEFAHFYDAVGEKIPQNTIENIVFLRDKLTAKTCLRLRGTDFSIFEFYADSKQTVADVETPYYYRGGNFEGLICELKGASKRYSIRTNVLIADSAHHRTATVTIFCNDRTLKEQIIAGLSVDG